MTAVEPQWTEKQKKALAFEANLCVLAGAGSGKTMTLVELIIRLLEGTIPGHGTGLDLRQVLALTYTEKAAREMRDRVRRALNKKIRLAEPENRTFWRKQRRMLDQAQITTIHGFCLRLLRRYGLEAGLDPDFFVLDQERDFKDDLIRDVLLNWLQEGRPDLLELLDYFPWISRGRGSGIDKLISLIIGRTRSFGRAQRPEQGMPVDIALQTVELRASAELAVDLLKSNTVPLNKPYGLKVRDFSQKVLEILSRNPSDDELLDLAVELKKDVKGNWFKAKPVRDQALSAINALIEERSARLARPIKEKIARLAEAMNEEIQKVKERRRALDFDDLLLKTKDLLAENLEVRAEVKKLFRVVLIDEFQDANRLQADILSYICEPDDKADLLDKSASPFEKLSRAERRLVVFGDPKQSIYRFRGAEVSVYGKLRDSIIQEGGLLTPLDMNFRSQGRLVNFFNAFFSDVMSSEKDFESAYGSDDVQGWHRPDLGHGPAAFLLEPPVCETTAEYREREAEALALHLGRIFSGEENILIGNPPKTPSPGDVAVLLRRFTYLKVYEEAFRRAGLPFFTVRGKGFFECQEVWDLVNLVFFLDDPGNGPALQGVLRSPLFSVSDEVITRLVWPRPGNGRDLTSYFSPDVTDPDWPQGLDRTEIDQLNYTREILTWLSVRAGRTFPSELIETAVEKTQFLAVLAAQSQGEQKVANVQKFIEVTRALPITSLSAPGELSRFLIRRLADSQDDPEAQISSEGADVIRIMTIHQAKGLQFPVVLIPDAGQKPRTNSSPLLFGAEDSFGVRFRDPEAGEVIQPDDYSDFQEQDKGRERAEYLRLLYVAATRAEDLLVFSGFPVRGSSDSWLMMLKDFALSRPDLLELTAAEIPGEGESLEQSPDVVDPGAPPRPVDALVDPDHTLNDRLSRVLERRSPQPSEITINVTDLAQFLHCPRRFFFETLLGASGQPAPDPDDIPENHSSPGAREKGIVFHYLLETFDLGATPPFETLYETARQKAGEEGWEFDDEVFKEITGLVHAFLTSEWGNELVAAPDLMVQRECPIWLKVDTPDPGVPDLIITGEIDLFYVNKDGDVRIVDYKYASPKDAGRYEPQVKTYALALDRAGLSKNMEAALWFAKGGEGGMKVDIPLAPGWRDEFEKLLFLSAKSLARLMSPDAKAPESPSPCPESSCTLKYVC